MRVRIVEDNYNGYEVQVKTWYWPFWRMMNFSNTFISIDKAELWARRQTCPVVYKEWRQ